MQDLDESVKRNVQERIEYIKQNGDGYVTVVNETELTGILEKLRDRRLQKCQTKKH